MGVSDQLHTLAILSPRKETPVLTGLKGLKNCRASPDTVIEIKNFDPAWSEAPGIQLVVNLLLTELSLLQCHSVPKISDLHKASEIIFNIKEKCMKV